MDTPRGRIYSCRPEQRCLTMNSRRYSADGIRGSAQRPDPRPLGGLLTPQNTAALAKYAALAGHTPTEFLNRYLEENMVALFENQRAGDLESHLANLEYRTRADAER